jgi:hypothetical protein
MFGFPPQVPSNATTIIPLTNTLMSAASININSTALILNKVYTSLSPSSDIFITGSGLFYSNLFGKDVAMIPSNPTTLVNSFALHENGMFAFLLSSNALWVGSTDTRLSHQVTNNRSDQNVYLPFFDTNGDLFELTHDISQIGMVSRQFYNRSTVLNSSTCIYSAAYFEYVIPYQSVLVISNSSLEGTDESRKIRTQSLPDTIYLDYQNTFSFQLYLVPTNWSLADSLMVFFELENSHILNIRSDMQLDHMRRTIVYTVSIQDRGDQRVAGAIFLAALRVIISGDNLGCLVTEEVYTID